MHRYSVKNISTQILFSYAIVTFKYFNGLNYIARDFSCINT